MKITLASYISLLKIWLDAVNVLLQRLQAPKPFRRQPTAEEAHTAQRTPDGHLMPIDDEQPAFMFEPHKTVMYHRHLLAKGILAGLVAELEAENARHDHDESTAEIPIASVLEVVQLLRAVGVKTHRLSSVVKLDAT